MSRFAALLTVVLSLAACGGASPAEPAAPTAPAVPPSQAPVAASAAPTVASVAPSAAAATSAPAAGSYRTSQFAIPFDVIVPSYVESTPADESANFVTWLSVDESLAIRFLHPVVVYQPGSTTTSPVPTDYLTYLLSQTDHGATFDGRKDTTIDGHQATILTVTMSKSIDGSLGCPDTGISADECFGIQPEYAMRLAVVTTERGPLLIWLRSAAHMSADVAAEPERFEQLLAGLHFAG